MTQEDSIVRDFVANMIRGYPPKRALMRACLRNARRDRSAARSLYSRIIDIVDAKLAAQETGVISAALKGLE